MATRKVRVPGRITDTYLDGTQAWYTGHESQDADDQVAYALFHRIVGVKAWKDRSRRVDMTDEERAVLLDYATAWEPGAADNAGPYDMDALADLRAIRSLIRSLIKEV